MGKVIVWLGDVSREATDETAREVGEQLKKERPDLASFGEVSIRPMGRRGSYEDAPATDLVATHCCVCGRTLLEAESIKSGIGPICAERTGYGREGLASEVRSEVNGIVYRLALLQKSPEAVTLLGRLRELDFGQIADRIEARLQSTVEIEVQRRGDKFFVSLPKLDDRTFRTVLSDLRGVPRRGFEPIEKLQTIPDEPRSKRALWKVLQKHFPGRLMKSDKGLTVIPNAA